MTRLWNLSKTLEGNSELLVALTDLLIALEYLDKGKKLGDVKELLSKGTEVLEMIEEGTKAKVDPRKSVDIVLLELILSLEEELSLRPSDLLNMLSQARNELSKGVVSARTRVLIEIMAKIVMRNVTRGVDALSPFLR